MVQEFISNTVRVLSIWDKFNQKIAWRVCAQREVGTSLVSIANSHAQSKPTMKLIHAH